ncbi:glycine cleavage system transcriptional repressor [Microbacterium sp. GXF7504]
MSTLVLTVVGDDRSGLVAEVADVVAAHGGNWEHSSLAELAGAFAGIIQVSVPAARADGLRAALGALEGLIAIAVPGTESAADAAGGRRGITLEVLGNDRPGIVKDLTGALAQDGVSVERMSTETRDAAMAGGRLFAATIAATVPDAVAIDDVVARLEHLAAEIQVDVTVTE